MRTRLPWLLVLVTLLGFVTPSVPVSHAAADGRTVVIVSGGNAVSPFTTPDASCATGLAAGNTDTALRQDLLDRGYTVYTSPAMAGRGPVVDQAGFGPFGDCPITLPDDMTVDSTASIDLAGEHLARFLGYLHDTLGVGEVDVVAHSMGGLYSRAAIRVLQNTRSAVRIRSLTMIGTPWEGSFLSDYANGITPLSDCLGDAVCQKSMEAMKVEVTRLMTGSGREVNQGYLMGPGGWNEFQAGVLDRIPVVLIGGDRFTKPGAVNPMVWPNDGIVTRDSALATRIDDRVLPHRRCAAFDDAHSIFVANNTGLAPNDALTWDPRVFEVVVTAIDTADTELAQPNRVGC